LRSVIQLYWDIGRAIAAMPEREGWGAGVIPRLARDPANDLPEVKTPPMNRRRSPSNVSIRTAIAEGLLAIADEIGAGRKLNLTRLTVLETRLEWSVRLGVCDLSGRARQLTQRESDRCGGRVAVVRHLSLGAGHGTQPGAGHPTTPVVGLAHRLR
jgi:hypothetical protein